MIKTTAGNLWEEIQAGKQYVERRLKERRELVRQYHGKYWGNPPEHASHIENHPYEYISLVLPQLVYSNPRFTIQSMRTTPIHRMVATALQKALNRWTEDRQLAELLRLLCFDYLTGWGVGMVTFEEHASLRLPPNVAKLKGISTPMWPMVTRLCPDDFFFDPQALSWEECRWMAHRRLWDLEDLQKIADEDDDGTWDSSVVSQLRADDRRENADNAPNRDQVWVYELWLPEDTEGTGKNEHGRIYTLVEGALSQDPDNRKFIRKPRGYYGPPTGPYAMFGAFPVADEPGFVPPLIATLQAQKEADAFSKAFSDSAKAFKQEFVTQNKKLAQIMQSSPHLHIHHVEEELVDTMGRPRYAEVKLGGATREQYEGVQQARERVERMTGMSDAMRGQTSGGETTATEEQIAFQGGSIRVDDLRERFTRRLVQLAKTVAWFMFTDEEFMIPVGGQEFGQNDVWFEGGAEGGLVELTGMTFYDMELVVEPYSMERITDSARMARLGQAAKEAVSLGAAMAQMPWLNWEEIVQDIGNAYNLPDYSSRFNWQALQALWAQGGMPMNGNQMGLNQSTLQSHTPPNTQRARVKSPVETQERPNGRSSGQYAKNGAAQP